MKVEDLKSLAILSDDRQLVQLSHHARQMGLVGVGYYLSDPLGDDTHAFGSREEAVKAAALFRAAYEMQQALKAIKSGGNKLYTRDWNMMITALALSENTESTAL